MFFLALKSEQHVRCYGGVPQILRRIRIGSEYHPSRRSCGERYFSDSGERIGHSTSFRNRGRRVHRRERWRTRGTPQARQSERHAKNENFGRGVQGGGGCRTKRTSESIFARSSPEVSPKFNQLQRSTMYFAWGCSSRIARDHPSLLRPETGRTAGIDVFTRTAPAGSSLSQISESRAPVVSDLRRQEKHPNIACPTKDVPSQSWPARPIQLFKGVIAASEERCWFCRTKPIFLRVINGRESKVRRRCDACGRG